MPKWSRDIPADPRGPAFLIMRTPPFKPLVATVTSEDLIGTFTHFFKGRTTPCEGTECPACSDGVPYRWHAYLSAYNSIIGLHFLFECTAQAADAFVEYRDAYQTTRGCCFQAHRLGGKPNGRILIKTSPAKLDQVKLPQPPDIIKCLSILWDLPTADLDHSQRNPGKDTTHLRHKPKSDRDSEPKK